MLKVTRRTAIKTMLERLDHRRDLLREKCVGSLVTEWGLPETKAAALVERWTGLVEALKTGEDSAWQAQAGGFGTWCAAQAVPFEAVMGLLHAYKRGAMPLLVREYPGVEGYLEAHLALDEALALLLGKIPGGYYGRGPDFGERGEDFTTR